MKTKKGVSLAELMVATVILVSCVLLLMGMFSAGAVRTRQARACALASFLARQTMEEELAKTEITDTQGSCTPPFETYTYTVTKKESAESSLLEQIEVTVTAPANLGGKVVKLVMLRAL
jgi:Tfp pilus assembly protein PilV